MAKKKSKRQILIRKAKAATILRKRIAKKDFWAFCLYYDPKFFSKRLFLKKVAEAFMRVYESYSASIIYRLAVSMPPRAGKSYISSLFIAWMYGHFPQESVMRNCCSDTLYNKLSYDTRDVVKSRRFKEIFPDIHLKGDKQNVKSWSVEGARQVSYFGGGVGDTVIGFGASMLAMTDDLYKSLEDALSDNNNEKVWSWKQGTHDSRIEGSCCMIDIGTRWSSNDVLGRMEEAGKYNEIIRIAALDENDETFCADVHTTEYYKELRSETDESIWMAEYMQEPFEAKGLLFPKSSLMRFKLADIAGKNLMEHSEPVILLIKEMMISAHHSQRCLVQNTSLPIFFSLKILSKSQNRAWRKWLLIQSAINYVLNQTMAGVYLLSMYANLLQLKRNRV